MSEITVKCFRRGDLELPSRIRRQSRENLEGNRHFRQHCKLACESRAQMASPVIKTRCQVWPGCPPTCQREVQTWLRNNPEDKGRAAGKRPCVHKELTRYIQGVNEPRTPATGQGTVQREGTWVPGRQEQGALKLSLAHHRDSLADRLGWHWPLLPLRGTATVMK